MHTPLVSVLVLNYRNAQATVQCVHALLLQTVADHMEIIVVDNHSEDDSIGVLRNRLAAFPNVRIVETPNNNGFGYGCNYGADYASGEYLLLNNPDKKLPPDGIERLIATLWSKDTIGIVAPKLVHDDGTRRLSMRMFPRVIDILARRSFFRFLFPHALRRYLMLDADANCAQEVDWVIGGCMLISRALFEDIGGFDERFFLFFEDTDLCRRCRQVGRTVYYDPSVVAKDKQSRLSGERFFDLFFKKTGRVHVMSAWKYFWKWGNREVGK